VARAFLLSGASVRPPGPFSHAGRTPRSRGSRCSASRAPSKRRFPVWVIAAGTTPGNPRKRVRTIRPPLSLSSASLRTPRRLRRRLFRPSSPHRPLLRRLEAGGHRCRRQGAA